jgi:hypothetical protein
MSIPQGGGPLFGSQGMDPAGGGLGSKENMGYLTPPYPPEPMEL